MLVRKIFILMRLPIKLYRFLNEKRLLQISGVLIGTSIIFELGTGYLGLIRINYPNIKKACYYQVNKKLE
jgi:hypothetical protein